MSAEYDIVVVGAGHGGVVLVQHLRRSGFDGAICLVGDEPHAPYQRPPLTKDFLLDACGMDALSLGLDAAALDVTLLQGQRVAAISPDARKVRLADGATLGYGKLVLATGSRPRRLAGIDRARPFYLTCLDDCLALKARLPAITRAVVIGGGFIGLEVASALRTLGRAVTVVEAQERLLARAATNALSDYLRHLHLRQGVELMVGAIVADASPQGVTLRDGTFLAADAVIVGVGALPNSELAEQAGLACDDGILVDAFMRTSDPHILAIGDCSRHPNVYGPRSPFRLESVQNAGDQAVVAAETIMGRERPYESLPTFWSDQYDARIAIAGISQDHDRVAVRGNPADNSFSVFAWRDGKLVSVESVNRPKDQRVARRLILDTALTPEQVMDETFDLRAALPA